MAEVKTTLDKVDRTDPRAWEAIFFTETDFQGDSYVAQIGNTVDFGRVELGLLPDPLNDILRSVKTGNLCLLKLYEDHAFEGGNEIVPGGSEIAKINLIGLTSFTASIDEDQINANIRKELLDNEKKIKNLQVSLEECGKTKNDFRKKLNDSEIELQKFKDKLEECEKKGKELKDQLDDTKVEDLEKLKDKLKDCEERGNKLKDKLDDLTLGEIDDLREKLKECQEAGKGIKKERDGLIDRLIGKKDKE